MKVLNFGATRCVVGPSWVATELPSGAEVHAHPQDSDEHRGTARELGYGADTAAMTRDHDPLHAAVAHWLGFSASLALRQAAGEPIDADVAALEEEAVLAIQRLCRATGHWPWRT